MSDPVSNADIEDVLSSIRRLVSDEPNAGQSAAPDDTDLQVERFVLTPAFRVAEPESDEVNGGDTPEVDTDPAANVYQLADPDPEPELAEPQAEPAETLSEEDVTLDLTAVDGDELNSQIAEEYQGDTEWTDEGLEAGSLPEDAEDTEEVSEVTEVAPTVEDSGPVVGMSLEERIAELETAIEQAPQEWEPDGSEDGSSDETTPISLNLSDDASSDSLHDALNTSAEMAEVEGVETDTPVAEDKIDASDSGDDVEAWMAEVATESVTEPVEIDAIVDNSDGAEQSDDGTEATADTDFDATHAAATDPQSDPSDVLRSWDESAMRDVTPEEKQPAAEPESATPDDATFAAMANDEDAEGGNFLADDEATLDEESLRALVSDLVREELQGVLGERITRNVRRLVRREIQRALTMRDLD